MTAELTLDTLPPLYPEPLEVEELDEETTALLDELEELAELLELQPPKRARPHALLPTSWRPWCMQRMVLRDYALGLAVVFVIVAGRQSGKAQPKDEPVLTPDGWRRIGDLKVGDRVFAGDGSVTRVTGVFEQGVRPVFQVTFDDGASTRCCADHLWKVQTRSDRRQSRGWSVMSLGEIRSAWGDQPRASQRVWIPVARRVDMPEGDLPLDPYLLGVLIGDGCLWSTPRLSSGEEEILARVRERLPQGVDLRHLEGVDHLLTTGRNGGRPNPLTEALRGLGLYDKRSRGKFIPEIYLRASHEQRLELLRGLMDTDGTCGKKGGVTFSTTSMQLAQDVVELVRSLGGKAKLRRRETRYTRDGEHSQWFESFRVTVRLPWENPFHLKRKADRVVRPTSTPDARLLYKIEPAGEAECRCISVAHESQTYVTKDFVVTHNTEVAVHLLLLVALERPKSYSIILAPNYIIAQTAIDKITERAEEIPGVVWREQKKRFFLPNGSVIQVFSADRPEKAGRGPTLDGILLGDEAAFLSVKARDATLGSLTAVRSPLKVFATTPKGKNWVHTEFLKPAKKKASYRFRSADSPYANHEEIAANRERMGAEMAAQEYDAVFVDSLLLAFPEPGRIFVESLPPRRAERQGNVVGFDIAKHQDWTVLTVLNRWGEGEIITRRQKAGDGETFYADLLAMAKEALDRYEATAVIDTENHTGPGEVLADLLEAAGYTVIRVPTGQDKVKARLIERAQAGYERREVKLRKNEHYDQAFREFQEFLCLQQEGTKPNKYRCPEGKDQAGDDYHDDCVISVCLAYWGITEADEEPEGSDLSRFRSRSEAPQQGGSSVTGGGYIFR